MEEKKKNQWKQVLHVVLSFVAIYVISMVFVLFRIVLLGANTGAYGVWEYLQLLVMPGLFFLAGYIGTLILKKPRYRTSTFLIAGLVYSIVLLLIWFVSNQVSAVLNMTAAQACYGLDQSLRSLDIVYNYEYTTVGKTDWYRFVILPLILFAADVLYWMMFLLGNHCASKPKKKRKKRMNQGGNHGTSKRENP